MDDRTESYDNETVFDDETLDETSPAGTDAYEETSDEHVADFGERIGDDSTTGATDPDMDGSPAMGEDDSTMADPSEDDMPSGTAERLVP